MNGKRYSKFKESQKEKIKEWVEGLGKAIEEMED